MVSVIVMSLLQTVLCTLFRRKKLKEGGGGSGRIYPTLHIATNRKSAMSKGAPIFFGSGILIKKDSTFFRP
jgi:hypothetical protein